MSFTHKAVKINITDVKVDLSKNVRLAADFMVAGHKVDTYDLGTMIQAVIDKVGIFTPLVINKDKSVLQGFRRTLAGQAIVRDPEKYLPDLNKRAEVLAALKVVPALQYFDLTNEEELELINDHGDRKGIGHTELIRTVWKLKLAGLSEQRIANQLVYAIADYTGNTRKLNTLPPIGSPERATRVAKWLHGTVGNFFLAVQNMGPRIQDALLITEMLNDGLLPKEGENAVKPLFKVSRDRVRTLSTAITQDKEKAQWDNENRTGPSFEAAIEKFVKEDASPETSSEKKDPRMTLKAMEEAVPNYQSTAFRVALKLASGKEELSAQDMDKAAARAESIMNLIDKHLENVANPELKDVLSRVHSADPVDFEAFLLKASQTVPENAPNRGSVSV
jgi:hypothetical protein